MQAFALAAAVLALAARCAASPTEKRVVYDPTVLYPAGGTVWTLGQRHNVTWDVSDAPPASQISNAAKIYLRKGSKTITNHLLASGFNLRSGHHEITVPTDIEAGTDYRIVLFGDSGNFGPQFTITATKPVFWGYPPVLYPHAGTNWQVGSTHNVTWDTSNAPADIANKGAIFLCQNRTSTAKECENTGP
ncbi:hypothetical protein AURDEDRAFT_84009 [Auricularia subglabra TFB-10046 SS5]|nr:hypothetical protein AURDEDRAFT_84009 [Auricularia subglabra TFB-10046 SS5]